MNFYGDMYHWLRVMTCYLMAPSHYLDQCWLIIKGVLWHPPESNFMHDEVIKWKHFPCNWPFVWGIHRSRWILHTKASLMFSLICVWINGWVNNREAGDLRRHHGHYDDNVMMRSAHELNLQHVLGDYTSKITTCTTSPRGQWVNYIRDNTKKKNYKMNIAQTPIFVR